MGLLLADTAAAPTAQTRELALLRELQCQVCPRNQYVGRIEPTGADKPLIYVIGEAPGKQEADQRSHFIGASGQLLRDQIPEWAEELIRWNNTVRSFAPGNATPEFPEIEACRPSVEKDIAQSKPEAIFGFGNVPLHWVSGFSGISLWRGRRIPVRIAGHACWYYPMLHPAFLLRGRRGKNQATISEDERMFRLDLKRAFREVKAGLPLPEPHSPAQAMGGVELLFTIPEIAVALDAAAKAPAVGIDYETSLLRPYWPESAILTAAVAWLDRTVAFPFDHEGHKWSAEDRKELDRLWVQFLRRAKKKYVHNLAFEMEWTGFFYGHDLLRLPDWEDSQSQAAIIDERRGKTKPGCFSLEFLVQNYFGFNLKKLSNVDRKNLTRVPVRKVLEYNGPDARYHLALGLAQTKRIEVEGLEEAYDLALRRVPTVVLSQLAGVPIEPKIVVDLQVKYGERIIQLEGQIQVDPDVVAYRRKTGRTFNPHSPQETLFIFNDMLKFKEVLREDRDGKPKKSVDEEVLDEIWAAHQHPLAKSLVSLRKAARQKSTYIDVFEPGAGLVAPDGLVHTVFNTTFAETGRLSSDSPNLQNFPKRGGEAKEVRCVIAAPPGHVVLAFDYGQLEARVIAMFTKDPVFCKALWENYDVHMEWAERIARAYPARIGGRENLTDKKVMKDFRTDIKNQWTFPLFFGASLHKASTYLKIPEDTLKPQFDDFWDQFSGVKLWQEELLSFYRKSGFVECLTGRRRRGPLTANQVLNSPIQGTAAELVMDAMCRLSETGDPELQPEINIHDDFTYVRVPANRVDAIAEQVVNHMLAVPFDWVNVPISVEMSLGSNWGDVEEVAKFSSDKWKWL